MHWQSGVVSSAADLDFRDVHGVDANTAYLLSAGEGEKSRIYKTMDAGRTWKLQFTNRDARAFFDGFAFWDAAHGIAFSDPVEGRFPVIRTDDGGANWKEIPRVNMPIALPGETAFAASGTSIAVAGRSNVWIATGGAAARVFRSADRGLTWTVAKTPILSGSASSGIFSIYASSPRQVWIAGGDYQKERESSANFAQSTDGGRTWALGPQLPGYRSAITVVSGEDQGVELAVGPSGSDYRRLSGGPWISIGLKGYDAISFLPGLATGWAVGEGGRIARWYPRVP